MFPSTRLFHRSFRLAAKLTLLGLAAPASAQLSVPSPQVWTQAVLPASLAAGPESYDAFGRALAAGDFDGDGFDDLAIGASGDDLPFNGRGLVHLLYGGDNGLSVSRAQAIFPSTAGPFSSLGDSAFGAVLAAGDFDGDGFDDLAVGAPWLDSFGGVEIFYGSGGGLSTTRTQWLVPMNTVPSVPDERSARFGAALTALDVNGDGFDELAVGQPLLRIGDVAFAGAVHVFPGTAAGLGFEPRTIDQSVLHNGTIGHLDLFVSTLASGDLNGDGRGDLIIGAPQNDINGAGEAGAVFVLHGTPNGPDVLTYTRLVQDGTSGANAPEANDHFGASLAVADLNRDGRDDLAVGVPGQSRFTPKRTYSGSGAVNLFYGAAGGVSTTSAAYLDQAAAGVGELESGDCFGHTIALGDISGDGLADLLVGVPYENDAGAYQRFFTGLSGVAVLGSVLQLQPGLGASEPRDEFAASMVLGDFDGNGLLDLAVGAPSEDLGAALNAGQVHVIYSEKPLVIGP